MGIIRNMMLKHSYNEIAVAVDVSTEEVKACIEQMITGTAIVTRQMVIDSKKLPKEPSKKKQEPKKKKPQKPKTEKKIKEEWENVKKERVMNAWESRSRENAKRVERNTLKTKHIDLSELIRVPIDSRTSIFINPGEDKEAAIAKFYSNRIAQKKSEEVY